MIDPKTQLCTSHQPGARERLRAAGKKGGAATAQKWRRKGLEEAELPDLRTPQDAAERLDLIAQAVGTGRLGHAEGRTMTGAVKEWLRAFEVGEMANEMEVLRGRLAQYASREAEAVT